MPGVFETLPALVNGNEALVRRGRDCTTTFLVEAGDTAWLISVHEGRVAKVERGPFLMRAWSFAVRAPAEAWQKFWEPMPAPGYHDIFAMTKGGHARVEGNLHPLMANLRFIKDVLAAPRRRA
ncbi:MAG: hypothetical protein HYU25_01835 [Candidatus Rokubacteria bacterium]|nr:hypothetical protein [Candidatus Rokubacteria bacterium]